VYQLDADDDAENNGMMNMMMLQSLFVFQLLFQSILHLTF